MIETTIEVMDKSMVIAEISPNLMDAFLKQAVLRLQIAFCH